MYYKQQLIFHQLYIDRCGNHMLIEKLAELKKKLLKSNYEIDDIEKKKEILLNTNSQHKRMLELFRSREAKLLREYVEEVHWDAQKASGNRSNRKNPRKLSGIFNLLKYCR